MRQFYLTYKGKKKLQPLVGEIVILTTIRYIFFSNFNKLRNNKSASTSSRQSEASGYTQTNLLECKIALSSTAFFILIPASAWAGIIASNFLLGYLWFWWIQ